MGGPDRAVLSSSLGRMTACRGGSSVGRVVAGGGLRGKRKKWPRDTSRLQELFVSTWLLTLDASANYCSFLLSLYCSPLVVQSNGDVILFSGCCRVGVAPGLNHTASLRKYPVRYATFQHSRLLCTANAAALPPSAHCVAVSTKALLWSEKVMLSLRRHCFCIGHHDAD